MDEKKRLGAWLRAARLATRMKAVAFAKRVGVSSATVTRWEKGDDHPSGAHLVKIAEALDIPLADLLAQMREDEAPARKENQQNLDTQWERAVKLLRRIYESPDPSHWTGIMVNLEGIVRLVRDRGSPASGSRELGSGERRHSRTGAGTGRG